MGHIMLEAWLWSLIPTFLLAVPATTVYLHRTVTHRALRLHPFAEGWFKLTNWISTGVDPAVWAAVHRKHHAYVGGGRRLGYRAVIVPLQWVGLASDVRMPRHLSEAGDTR